MFYNGLPAPNAYLTACPQGSDADTACVQTRSDNHGAFAFRYLSKGHWIIRVGTAHAVAASPVRRITLRHRIANLEIRVADE